MNLWKILVLNFKMSLSMKCLDKVCLEEAIELEVYNGVPIRTCKNGHRTGKIEDKEQVITWIIEAA